MYNRQNSSIEKKEQLYATQYSFRDKSSTQHAILDIVKIRSTSIRKFSHVGLLLILERLSTLTQLTTLFYCKLYHYVIRGIYCL